MTLCPGPAPTPAPLAAWLALGQIEALEGRGMEGDQGTIDGLYRYVADQYDIKALDGIFLLKLARWSQSVGEDESAIAYYSALTRHRDASLLPHHARIERARLLRKSGDMELRRQAIDDLQRVINECDAPALVEIAGRDRARAFAENGEWAKALVEWESYLARNDWLMARAEATYGVASCHDHLLRYEEALQQYVNTYVHFEGQVEWSARAFVRAALIVREQGDEKRAIGILDDMMARMGHLAHPIVNKARTLHVQWTNQASKAENS